jgi:Xaa-Pro aminopeptidase
LIDGFLGKEFFENNRRRFAEKMENNSLLVLFSGYAPVKRGDEFYPFAIGRNFYYLTGIDIPNLTLTILKNADGVAVFTIYLERDDDREAKWTGRKLDPQTAKEKSAVESFAYVDELHQSTAKLFARGLTTLYVDLENRSFNLPLTLDVEFANQVRRCFPAVTLINAYPIFFVLRSVKSAEEISMIKKAISVTAGAFYSILKNVRDGMREHELEAYFDFMLKQSGARDRAFKTIVASGKNAAVLHYMENDSVMRDGDLVLLDFGASWNWYSADISRTFPVCGTFTERQKILYNIVLGGNELIIGMIKPGVPFKKLNETLLEYYFEKLSEIGLVKEKSEVADYYYHGVSHTLGLETHDIGRGLETELLSGMVLTVEPGLYIASEGIGIRIEDDILVTEGGCEVLSAGIIKGIDEIEKYMNIVSPFLA